MKCSHAIAAACVISVFAGASAFAQTAPARPTAARPAATAVPPATIGPLVDANRPIMQVEEVGLKGNTLVYGDPAKMGPYIMRMRLAANQTARPHYDDQDRFITVLKGTVWIGKGEVFAPDKLLPIREGGVMYLPANTKYFQVAGEEGAIVQISGVGPVKSTHIEMDAKGNPVPENGPYPNLNPPARRRGYVDPDLLTPDQIEQMEREAAAAKAAAAKKAAGDKAAQPAATPEKK